MHGFAAGALTALLDHLEGDGGALYEPRSQESVVLTRRDGEATVSETIAQSAEHAEGVASLRLPDVEEGRRRAAMARAFAEAAASVPYDAARTLTWPLPGGAVEGGSDALSIGCRRPR
ncbi:hypothetical protein LRS74_00965 [Streptomyces sp. LX-29]|uniref:hypothetical protein n=1 Tax=Streptomyces sp. LX-29 TaxID=2900152 RepID=UPI00240D37F0|nr:hypothetical protein [Streptomyces sp. LX-29]WFB05743.1 hypothetical protein LRS74_00965 [Streptomyces sp. LX-29]